MLTTSVSQSLKRSSSASYEGICAEHTLLKANGTKASTTFFLPRKSARCQSSRLPVLRVKSGATSPTFKVFDSERLLLVMGGESFLKYSVWFAVICWTVHRPLKINTHRRYWL